MPTKHGKSPWPDSLKPLESTDHSDPFCAAEIIKRDRTITEAIRSGALVPSFYQSARAIVAAGIAQGLIHKPNSTSR